MWKQIELRLQPSDSNRPLLRYHLQSQPRLSSTPLFYNDERYNAPAVVVRLQTKRQNVTSLEDFKATLELSLPEVAGNISEHQVELHLESGEIHEAVWIQGLTAAQGLQLQNALDSLPGLYISESEEAHILGEMSQTSLYIHPLPRIVSHAHARIADNTDYPLSMERLLHNFVHRFSDQAEHTLSNVDIATAFLYHSGLQYVLRLLENPNIQKLRLLCSGKADGKTVDLLQQVFVQSLDTLDEEAQSPGYELLYQAIQEERFQLQVYPHAFLHAKLYLGYDFIDKQQYLSNGTAVIGSSNITAPGILHKGNLELNAAIYDREVLKNLYDWFEARWEEAEDPRPVLLDVLTQRKQQVAPPEFQIEGLLEVWKAGKQKKLLSPGDYLTFLARLYRKQIGLTPDALTLPPYPQDDARQINPSPEQESGVLGLTNRLLQLRFAFLADSVGLGKTITALGTAWYLYRLQQAEKIAVIAPRKLMGQWKQDTKNIRMPDNIVTYVNRHKLERKPDEEAASMLAPYDLLLIEEAHESLRNRKNKLWNHIRNHLQKNPKCRLLLISATPWNNKREDIFNYILLAWQDGLSLLSDYPTLHESVFYRNLQWFRGQPSTAARTFEGLGLETYRSVFDTTFVQRTRHRIAQMYKGSFDFPERNVLPYNIPPSTPHDEFFEKLGKALEELYIPYREPFRALQRAASRVVPELPEELQNVPESSLHRGFIIQLYKRAESSLFALAVSLQNIAQRLNDFEQELVELVHTTDNPKEALREWLERVYLRLEHEVFGEASFEDINEDLLSTAEKSRYGQLQRLFEQLDNESIKQIVREVIQEEVVPDQEVLKSLRSALTMPLEQSAPKTLLLLDLVHLHYEKERKVVMIGTYTDTVVRTFIRLLAAHPEQRIGLALGGDEGWLYDPHQCQHAPMSEAEWGEAIALSPKERRKALLQDTNRAILTNRANLIRAFAPRAQKISQNALSKLGGEIDMLLGTEAISMGQNLQDATSLIHLDMPWNPMILEQRIGRVDRRGGGRLKDPSNPNSQKIVDIYYCWSHSAIENEIALRDKLKTKSESAIQDTNFDELLLYELRDLIEQVRQNNQNVTEDEIDPHAIASFLNQRQQSLVEEQSVPQGISSDGGSFLDGVRLLATWAQEENIDLDQPPNPVIASGYRASPEEQGRWVITIALQPRNQAGHVLGPEQLETLIWPRIPEQPMRQDLESAILGLQEAEEAKRHTTAPGLAASHWTNSLSKLEQELLSLRDNFLQQHNELVTQSAKKASESKQQEPSVKFRKQCYRAFEALQNVFEQPYYQSGPGLERLEALEERLVFLLEHLNTSQSHLIFQQSEQESVSAAIQFIIHQTRRFIDEEFDEIFLQAVGELWASAQAQETITPSQMKFDIEVEGRWESLDIRVLSAAYIV